VATDPLRREAEALYVLPPDRFTAARNARAAELRDDPELSARLKKLRRPAPAAWVVNLLVRERGGELEGVLQLGEELRSAQAQLDRSAMTKLAAERRRLVAALAKEGATLAEQAGARVTAAVVEAVAGTLEAGMADADAADAIRTGRLIRPLESIGFDAVDLTDSVAVPEAGSPAARPKPVRPKPRPVTDPDAELRRARTEADEVLRTAERAVAEAEQDLAAVDERIADLRRRLAELEDRRREAKQHLDHANADRTHAERRRRALG
jgi:DNA-binding transcriptional MerR regulator